MTKSRLNEMGGNGGLIGAKAYLEFAVHLIEIGYFNPIVFCHDNFWFDRNRHAQVMIGFINLLTFLYTCGITIDTELIEPCDCEKELYRGIMCDEDLTGIIKCYVLSEIDFTEFSLRNASVPDGCREDDFILCKLYLQLKAGTALNRKAIERIAGRRYTDSEMITLRKQLQRITGKKIIKREDNSYEMR